jgi:hypothetical protein
MFQAMKIIEILQYKIHGRKLNLTLLNFVIVSMEGTEKYAVSTAALIVYR